MLHALVIQDDPFIAIEVEGTLRRGGADSVEIAVTEAEAIAAADRRRPDFIAADVRLVEGTGPAAVAAITARVGSVPVVFVTANPDACEPLPGGAEIMVKPVDLVRLLAVFRRLVFGRDRFRR